MGETIGAEHMGQHGGEYVWNGLWVTKPKKRLMVGRKSKDGGRKIN